MDKHYTIGILGLGLLFASMTALFCYLVDPYGIYYQQSIEDREALQIDAFRYLRLTKAYQLEKIDPELLILGSSRAANLIASSNANGRQGYNASLPGMTLYEIKKYLRHATQFHKPKKVIIALDFPSFFDQANKFQSGYVEARLATTQDDLKTVNAIRRHFLDYYATLLTSKAIFDSIHALRESHERGITVYSDGSWAGANPVDPGTRRDRFFLIARQYHGSAKEARIQDSLRQFAAIIRYCYQEKIEVSFYISPIHYLMVDAYQDAKLLSEFFSWHQKILNILDIQAQAAGQPPFPLFAFQNDFLAVGEDILSPSNDGYFFDDVMHFNFAYGDIIRDAILNKTEQSARRQHSHIQLDQSNLDQYISAIETNLQRFRETNAELLLSFYNNHKLRKKSN